MEEVAGTTRYQWPAYCVLLFTSGTCVWDKDICVCFDDIPVFTITTAGQFPLLSCLLSLLVFVLFVPILGG